MVRLPRLLLDMLRYIRDRLLEFCNAPTEAPEELLNSGIGVLTREDESTHNPESLRNRSNSTQQLQKDNCTTKLSPAIAKDDDFGMNHYLGVQAEKEKEETYGRMDVVKLQGILSKLEVSQDYALLARQVRQEGISSAETLRGVLSLIFKNAVIHPTQCAMLAQLCVHLSRELPEFPGEQPGDKPITFQQVLLNKCQEECEKLTKPEQAVERDDEKEKRVKLRTTRNIKPIGELFNERLLPERIVHACIQGLLGQDPRATPAEENVEALCQLFTTVGKQLEESTESKVEIDTYFARLNVIGANTALPSRIQNMVRSVFDLRSKKWVSPREEMKAMKINKIRAEAKLGLRPEMMAFQKGRPEATPTLLPGAEGMIPGISVVPAIHGMPGMPGMPGGGGVLPGAPMMGSFIGQWLKPDGSKTVSNMPKSQKDSKGLLPVPGLGVRGPGGPMGGARYGAARQARFGPGFGSQSVWAGGVGARDLLQARRSYGCSYEVNDSLGTRSPVAKPTMPPVPADLTRKSVSLVKEYFSIVDLNEASLCVQELNSPSFHPEFVRLAITTALDVREKECSLVLKLLAHLQSKGVISSSDLERGMLLVPEGMEDKVIDAPLAPKLLGGVLSALVLSGALELQLVQETLWKFEDEFLQQDVLSAVVAQWKLQENEVQLGEVCRKASVDKEGLLRVAAASDLEKLMEFGAGRVAAMPKLMVRDHFGVRANKDDFNLRGLLQRVRTFDK